MYLKDIIRGDIQMKFDYMTEIEHTVPYYQFPKFLLELPLPQNARILYMLLYDRSRISLKNRWADTDGRICFIFPITKISSKIGNGSNPGIG